MFSRIAMLFFVVCVAFGAERGADDSTNRADDGDISQNIFILEPINQSAEQKALGKRYTDEGYRAARFGSKRIARDLFYKACALGDTLGCLSLNELNAPIKVDNLVAKKQECGLGVGEACFWLFRYYAGESTLDAFKTDWYLDKACRVGVARACELKMARFKPYIVDDYQLLGNKCHKNDAQSCYALGIAHITGNLYGKKVARNQGYALKLLQKSCALGAQKACSEIIRIESAKR